MSETPPSSHFAHHGVVAETRDQWLAREAAKAAQNAAEESRRQAELVAALSRERAEAALSRQKTVQHNPAAEEALGGLDSASRDRRQGAIWARLAVGVAVVAGIAIVTLFFIRGERSAPRTEPGHESSRVTATPDSPVVQEARVTATPSATPRHKTVRNSEARLTGTGRGGLVGVTHHEPERPWADAPTIAPQSQGWWCICYRTKLGAPHTACRRQVTECETFRSMIQERGSRAILRGSATSGACRHVGGSYPWDTLGHRESWRSSSYPGATQAPMVCAL